MAESSLDAEEKLRLVKAFRRRKESWDQPCQSTIILKRYENYLPNSGCLSRKKKVDRRVRAAVVIRGDAGVSEGGLRL